MKLERGLQIVVATMAALGTTLLGLGERSALIPIVAVFVAVTSVYFTDMTDTFRLSRNIATFAAIGAVVVAITEAYRLGTEHRLLAITNLLMYLQVVLMYRPKDVRVYWQLLLLNLLQVVVGSALSLSLLFGLLMMAYLFLGLFALLLFLAYREALRFQPAGTTGTTGAGSGDAERGDRRPFASGFSPACREELFNAAIGRDLARHVLGLGTVTLLLTFLMFFLVPRLGKGALLGQSTTVGQLTVGFNETVELGKLGEAFEDPASVMRVWFTEAIAGRPYAIENEPLFRGAVVDTYRHGAWSLQGHPNARSGRAGSEGAEPVDLPAGRMSSGLVLERIAMEPQSEDTVFSILPVFRIDYPCPVKYHPSRKQLVRKNQHERLDFVLATTGFEAGRQADVVAAERGLNAGEQSILTQLPARDATGRDPLERLKAFAAAAVNKSKLPESDRLGRARALEQALRDPSRFEYTLTGQRRDPALDPIEDFIAINPRGHCEYFSSALTLMLRSQNIPARMVLGYKGSEFNSLGNYYQVRKLHAHSWVEAYLGRQYLPGDRRNRGWPGGWLTLDPTPGSSGGSLRSGLTWAERARDWIDFGDYLWSSYVVGLNAKRQGEFIYGPLGSIANVARQVFSRSTWTETVPRALRAIFPAHAWNWLKQNWRSWQTFTAGLLLGLGAVVGGWLLKRILRRRALRRGPSVVDRPRAAVHERVAFYERLEMLLARCGIRRGESQTQHEFAMAVAGQFFESAQLAPVACLPRRVVDAFYRVRFGRHALDKPEVEEVEQALRDLQECLADRTAGLR